ncbi:hypothetical protein SLEP1_g3344 [Rubroshorea leprosula]|uniref:Uncharacterized protein n=1 Tax=Rubroshorea leprosula TaxID=152421 RepID=A0AAV5HTT5_9ROSI|nr:hypothetical protein SLEP1_g3344 [Rubroshorea leprosula]
MLFKNSDGDDVTNWLEDDLDCENEDNESRDISNSTGSTHSEYQDGSDGEVNFIKVLSTMGRKKDGRSEWKDEADMLGDFGKDPNLCMKGVCAIHSRDISKERAHNKTFYFDEISFHDETFYHDENIDYQGQDFNKYDVPRGSNLACYLTGDDPSGDVKKSVEELQEYDPQGVDVRYKLAARYSRQLFEIYKNKEDPYFPH